MIVMKFWQFSLARILIFACLFAYGWSAVAFQKPLSPLTVALNRIKQQPANLVYRLDLVKIYLEAGLTSLAEQEYAYIGKQASGLGISDLEYLSQQLYVQPVKQQQQYMFWQKIASQYPDYADAWLQLLFLAEQQKDNSTIREAYLKLKELDPFLANEVKLQFPNITI